MATTTIMRRTNRTLAGGKVRIQLPHVQVTLPDRADLIADLAAHIERKLRERTKQAAARFGGLARWLEQNIRVDGNAVTWPASPAVDRMAQHSSWLPFVDPKWIEEVVQAHVAQAFSPTPRKRLFAGA